jgi:hypothetical protein
MTGAEENHGSPARRNADKESGFTWEPDKRSLPCAKSRLPGQCGIRLESKPVSYLWFPSQVGLHVSNPGYSIRANILANVVAEKAHTVISRHTLNLFLFTFLCLSCQFPDGCLFIQQHPSNA